jgi:molecular chaperone DnaJ
MDENPYHILGVDRSATNAEIKKAFRSLSLKYHPDKHNGDKAIENLFKQILQAYQILNDPEKKKKFDKSHPSHTFSDVEYMTKDYVEQILYQTGSSQHNKKSTGNPSTYDSTTSIHNESGGDIEQELTITIEESISGTNRDIITMGGDIICCLCHGSRKVPNTTVYPCSRCSGSGTTINVVGQHVTCIICKGHGDFPMVPCTRCNGWGKIPSEKIARIRIPAGIEENQILRFRGHGHRSINRSPGDLLITVRFALHNKYVKNGFDLHCNLEIPLIKAMQREDMIIQSITDDMIMIGMPDIFQPGITTTKIIGKGLKSNKGQCGDLIIQWNVKIPCVKTEKSKLLLQLLMAEVEE